MHLFTLRAQMQTQYNFYIYYLTFFLLSLTQVPAVYNLIIILAMDTIIFKEINNYVWYLNSK